MSRLEVVSSWEETVSRQMPHLSRPRVLALWSLGWRWRSGADSGLYRLPTGGGVATAARAAAPARRPLVRRGALFPPANGGGHAAGAVGTGLPGGLAGLDRSAARRRPQWPGMGCAPGSSAGSRISNATAGSGSRPACPDPARAARLWLVLAVATVRVLSVGGMAELAPPRPAHARCPAPHSLSPAATASGRPPPRPARCFRRGAACSS